MRQMIVLFVAISALLLLMGAAAGAQGGYDLAWWSVDGGGVTFSTGGGYTLGSTTGQADAGVLAGGGYTLTGGFWGGTATGGVYEVFLPLVVRGQP